MVCIKRRAWICPHETNKVRDCNARTFLMPDEPERVPQCSKHGAMVKQPNHPYKGKAT